MKPFESFDIFTRMSVLKALIKAGNRLQKDHPEEKHFAYFMGTIPDEIKIGEDDYERGRSYSEGKAVAEGVQADSSSSCEDGGSC